MGGLKREEGKARWAEGAGLGEGRDVGKRLPGKQPGFGGGRRWVPRAGLRGKRGQGAGLREGCGEEVVTGKQPRFGGGSRGPAAPRPVCR